ncbi:hypothetical protein M9H77_23705 [Catharanthus roseus]|uniref:Uncharacterized protein n=1 Tax=Catharanthus roseus TaxID=4058 RepID=A0ACC0AWK9_CATRO|nr:hypothetical protein M9H77_23705 [Catharanthus roseus]
MAAAFLEAMTDSGALSPRRAKIQATFAHLGKTAQTSSSRLTKGNEDPSTFKEILEPKEYIDHGHLFTRDQIFNLKDELVDWAKQTAMKANTYLIVNRAEVQFEKKMKPIVDDKEEEVPIKMRGTLRDQKSRCPFKLKGEQMATSENWQLFVHNGRHNYKIAVYNHGHAQAAKLTEEQLQQNEQFRKSHVPPLNIL